MTERTQWAPKVSLLTSFFNVLDDTEWLHILKFIFHMILNISASHFVASGQIM